MARDGFKKLQYWRLRKISPFICIALLLFGLLFFGHHFTVLQGQKLANLPPPALPKLSSKGSSHPSIPFATPPPTPSPPLSPTSHLITPAPTLEYLHPLQPYEGEDSWTPSPTTASFPEPDPRWSTTFPRINVVGIMKCGTSHMYQVRDNTFTCIAFEKYFLPP